MFYVCYVLFDVASSHSLTLAQVLKIVPSLEPEYVKASFQILMACYIFLQLQSYRLTL